MPLQISKYVAQVGQQAMGDLAEQFAHIDAVSAENTRRVLEAFQDHRVAEAYFSGTTGYGYDDLGRDKLDEIYAQIFGTEAALAHPVRQRHPRHRLCPVRRPEGGGRAAVRCRRAL